jgi:hypothetical protein
MVVSSAGLGPETGCSGNAGAIAHINYRPILSSERVLNINTPQLSDRNEKSVHKFQKLSRHQDNGRQNVGRNLT